jgi:antitoxin FitA
MATLQIENLPDEIYRSIQTFATAKRVSLNDAVIQMLAQAINIEPANQQAKQQEKTKEALTGLRNFPRKDPADFGLPDSTQLIREDRDR